MGVGDRETRFWFVYGVAVSDLCWAIFRFWETHCLLYSLRQSSLNYLSFYAMLSFSSLSLSPLLVLFYMRRYRIKKERKRGHEILERTISYGRHKRWLFIGFDTSLEDSSYEFIRPMFLLRPALFYLLTAVCGSTHV